MLCPQWHRRTATFLPLNQVLSVLAERGGIKAGGFHARVQEPAKQDAGKRHLSTVLDAVNSLGGESLLSLVLQSVCEIPRKKFFDPIDRMIGDMFEDVGQIRFWVQAN